MIKSIICFIVFALFIFGSCNALDAPSHVEVNNAIVPLNSNYASQLSATITISNIGASVGYGSSDVLNVKSEDAGAIVVSAPFCGQYPGYGCFVPLPDGCINKVGLAGKLIISAIITEYGLDLRSLRCFYIPDMTTSDYVSAPAKSSCGI